MKLRLTLLTALGLVQAVFAQAPHGPRPPDGRDPGSGAVAYWLPEGVTGPVPKIIEGCDWIRTMNGGKFTQPISTDPPFGFTVTADCTVYVAHDDQQQGRVAWLSDWTETQETINVCGGLLERRMPMRVYSRKFRKGEKVTPGANSAAPRQHGVMFITLVKRDDGKPSPAPAPRPAQGSKVQRGDKAEIRRAPGILEGMPERPNPDSAPSKNRARLLE